MALAKDINKKRTNNKTGVRLIRYLHLPIRCSAEIREYIRGSFLVLTLLVAVHDLSAQSAQSCPVFASSHHPG